MEVALVRHPLLEIRGDVGRHALAADGLLDVSLVSAQKVLGGAVMGIHGHLAGTSANALVSVSALAETTVHSCLLALDGVLV
jgi:hypothetical protein